ncbi:hypothetical protein AMECASPLE_021709 [Ameca splendens]|uniref:Uncharacterized protein n=1 Tax=Ameca splendens TaxID=208324 RepID=A0ABV0YF71_9TELE
MQVKGLCKKGQAAEFGMCSLISLATLKESCPRCCGVRLCHCFVCLYELAAEKNSVPPYKQTLCVRGSNVFVALVLSLTNMFTVEREGTPKQTGTHFQTFLQRVLAT